MKKIFYILLLVFLNANISAQMNGVYGNEWINFTQKYFKIKVSKDAIYVIGYNDFISAGLAAQEVANINPNNIQLFYRGIEIPIYVSAQGKAQMNNTDWIEFFGQKNDGKLDQPLYTKPEFHPQNYKSLFNDTAVYFITWTAATAGKRFTNFFKNDYSNYTPLSNFIHKEAITYNSYYDGLNYTSQLKYHQSSNYTEGEGFISGFIWNKAVVNSPVSVIDVYKNGADLNFKTEVFGVRDPVYKSSNNNYSHHVISKLTKTVAKTNTTLDSLDKYFTEYEHPTYEMNIPASKLDTGINKMFAYFNIINDLGIVYDISFIHKLEFEYPRLFKLRFSSQFGFTIPASASSFDYINISDFGDGIKNKPYFYDLANGVRAACTVNGNNLDAIIPSSNQVKYIYLADSADRLAIGYMQQAIFVAPKIANGTNYLIISHKQFAATTKKYADYRDLSFKTSTVWIDELFDQFCYGYNSPLAIRNYCNYILQNNDVKPELLLLIGKGIQTDVAKALGNINFVPTWGVPGTDIPLTAGLNGTTYEAAIPTGRIPVVNDSQLLVYLTKLQVYEKDINTLSLWKKNIMHTGGGIDKYQTLDLKAQLKMMQAIAERDSMGAVFSEYYKFESVPVTGSLSSTIKQELKNGKSFTFYFGHGASDRMEIDMGDPTEVDNINKLPVMMTAGCLLGNSYFSSTPQMGEKWLFAHREDKTTIKSLGAIAWIGNTWFGYLYQLADYGRSFYTNAFNKNYGKNLGTILQNTVRDYQDTTSVLIETHCKQVVLLGDPAIKLYSPAYPDYLISKSPGLGYPSSLSIYPDQTTAMSDSFAIKVDIYNQGKSITDSIKVRVTRKFPDGKTRIYDDLMVLAPKFSTEIYFWIKSKDIATKGLNKFTVEVNPDKKINEAGAYSNNIMQNFDYYMPDNNASLLFPYDYSTVSTKKVTITAQAFSVVGSNISYTFELDTNYKFSSNYKQTITKTGNELMNVNFTLLDQDSTPYYVRVKLTDTIYKVWDTKTFTYIAKSTSGWAQIDYPQYNKAKPDQIFMNDAERNYSFSSMTSNTYYFYSVGKNRSTFQNNTSARVFRKNNGENMAIVNGQVKNGWGIVAIDPSNELE